VSPNVPQALTAKEWSKRGFRRVVDEENNDLQAAKIEDGNVYREHDENVDEWQRLEHPHAMAALCLYRQTYGFTREDVEILRAIGTSQLVGGRNTDINRTIRDRANGLADRIAALLPPSDSTRAQDE
jgi:hypothetical protein